ncbi:MAG: sensor histidine kinase [Planctomycetota bacterium]
MKRNHRRWWLIYGACALSTLVALTWMTRSVLELERAEQRARASTAHEAALRLALWRMDSWFAPHLEQEAARPYHEYLPYFSEERAYTRLFHRIEPGEVLTTSPLLAFRSEIVRIHFQVDARGAWSSPQVPTGNLRDLAETNGHDAGELDRMQAQLADLAALLGPEELACAQVESESALIALISKALPPEQLAKLGAPAGSKEREAAASAKNERDLSQRAQQSYLRQKQNFAVEGAVTDTDAGANAASPANGRRASSPSPSALVPVWFTGPAPVRARELCFVRRVRVGGEHGEELVQGFVADWPHLRMLLLEQVRDLFGDADLVPQTGAFSAGEGRQELASAASADAAPRLAAFPAELSAHCPPAPPLAWVTPVRATLWTTWLAALIAVAAVGVTLHASIAHGEKRSRFASAVTHELRTPLTTFRMYSEMLAKGMVPPEQRATYLETLEKESERLAHLVENVMVHAQLEEGRRKLARERMPLDAILERVLPMLERRARDAGAVFTVDVESARGALLATDAHAVGQILLNLVDNACKYGRTGTTASIEIDARASHTTLALRVRDHGPGVPPALARAIFQPFERGERDERDPSPGVGLGLAIARGLARELGGDLRLEHRDGAGACFCLELPLAG